MTVDVEPHASGVEKGMWVIGYGSLIFKPPPHFSLRLTGHLKGFVRRFWQSSSDHRGTPESPGRVVTLIPMADLGSHSKFHSDLLRFELKHPLGDVQQPVQLDFAKLNTDDLRVLGVAYYIPEQFVEEVTEYLDEREQDGYTSHSVPFYLSLTGDQLEDPKVQEKLQYLKKDSITNDYYITSTIYIGTIENESFIGPEDIHETANTIRTSVGPSGKNEEYLVKLAESITHLGLEKNLRDHYLESLVGLVCDYN